MKGHSAGSIYWQLGPRARRKSSPNKLPSWVVFPRKNPKRPTAEEKLDSPRTYLVSYNLQPNFDLGETHATRPGWCIQNIGRLMNGMPKEFGGLTTSAKLRLFGARFKCIREERGDVEAWWSYVHKALK